MNTVATGHPWSAVPLGGDWRGYFGASAFSILLRAIRLNFLRGSDLRAILGVRLRKGDDLFRRMTRFEPQQLALAKTFPMPDFSSRTFWRCENWWPFGGPIAWGAFPWRLRICPSCMRSCYHSMLFQMPGVLRCPWHGDALIENCPRCDRAFSMDLGRQAELGQCDCGHDPVDYVATAEGASGPLTMMCEATSAYLRWAETHRRESWLVAPEASDDAAWKALHHLCGCLPLAMNRVQNGDGHEQDFRMVSERIQLDRSIKFGGGRLSPNSGLESYKPSMAALPTAWYTPLVAVERQLRGMLAEMAQSGSADAVQLTQATAHLPTYLCGRRVFFQTECLHRVVLRTLAKLSGILSATAESPGESLKELAAMVKRHALGRILLERCIRQMLLRGFADGARVVLGRHVPSLYANTKWKPVVRFPWLLLKMPLGYLPSAHIAWTSQRGTD